MGRLSHISATPWSGYTPAGPWCSIYHVATTTTNRSTNMTTNFAPTTPELEAVRSIAASYWEFNSEQAARIVAAAVWVLLVSGKPLDAVDEERGGQSVLAKVAAALWEGEVPTGPVTVFHDEAHEAAYRAVVEIIAAQDAERSGDDSPSVDTIVSELAELLAP